MVDVFISFSARGGIVDKPWISDFTNDIKQVYKAETGMELKVWHQFSNEGSASTYREDIDNALAGTKVLVVVMDPGYLESEEALAERSTYEKRREKANRKNRMLKVIKLYGKREDEIKTFVRPEVKRVEFRELQNGSEVCFARDHPEYNARIAEEFEKVCEYMKAERLENTLAYLKTYLSREVGNRCLYLPVAGSDHNETRRRFIGELLATVKKKPQYRTIKIIPDVLALTAPHLDFEALLTTDNEFREEAIALLIRYSFCALYPISYNTPADGEKLYEQLSAQLDAVIRACDSDERYTALLSFNTSEDFKQNSPFLSQLSNPAIEAAHNIRVFSSPDIVQMIEQAIQIIEPKIMAPVQPVPLTDKKIYLIKNDDREHDTQEIGTIKDIAAEIQAKRFTRFDSYNMDDVPIAQVRKEYAGWIEKADGIILYMGVHDKLKWVSQWQGTIYRVLEQKVRQNILARSVFIDQHQPERENPSYTGFGFHPPLTNCNPEVRKFLEDL